MGIGVGLRDWDADISCPHCGSDDGHPIGGFGCPSEDRSTYGPCRRQHQLPPNLKVNETVKAILARCEVRGPDHYRITKQDLLWLALAVNQLNLGSPPPILSDDGSKSGKER